MGDIADAVLDGTLCQDCGALVDGDAPGHPRSCCAGPNDRPPELAAAGKRQPCPICGKKVRGQKGISDHARDVHGVDDIGDPIWSEPPTAY